MLACRPRLRLNRFLTCTFIIRPLRFLLCSNVCIFLAIKIEACPYTEVAPFTRRLLRVRGVEEDDVVTREIPLLMGINYQLTLYHPYRPLKALLGEIVEAYALRAVASGTPSANDGAGAGAAASSSSLQPSPAAQPQQPFLDPADPEFTAAWDALQARAFDLADASLTTDCPLRFTPAQIASACLLLAASLPPLPKPAGTAPPAHASSLQLVLALRTVAPASVAWFVEPELRAKLAAAKDGHAASAVDDAAAMIREAVASMDAAAAAAAAEPLAARLRVVRDPALATSEAALEAREQALQALRADYKASKPAARTEAQAIMEELASGSAGGSAAAGAAIAARPSSSGLLNGP